MDNHFFWHTSQQKGSYGTQADAQAVTINAKAQADANTLITQSLTPELLQYQYLQKISGVQTVFLPSGGNFILPLPGTPK